MTAHTVIALSELTGRLATVRGAFASGRTRAVNWRLHQLGRIERLLDENEDQIATALGQDAGRETDEVPSTVRRISL
ncbi:hypothetical protein [Mycobacterium parmense]|uniref:Aldehyde dehydrogenase n=1 Tax=Mycobacterium parmense TaxID=185642 RepID=A0A7I7YX01_9MYCO|nr:hypothetical protein [Mycobacterium parmense]BBZ45494.1 hypothetical protein MPRM_27750 [Mycobacterium parmense]